MDTQKLDRNRGVAGNAADSTQLRVPRALETESHVRDSSRHTDPYPAGAKSIRARGPASRGGLALKLAVPIVIALLAASLVALWVLNRRVFAIQMENLGSDAADLAYTTGLLGRLIIAQRNHFLATHPDYQTSAEWKTGEHWLFANGIVGEQEWVELTGFGLGEIAPVAALERASQRFLFSRFDDWLAPAAGTEIVAVHLYNADGVLIADSVNRSFPLQAGDVRARPASDEYTAVGRYRIRVDHLDDAEPEPLVRGVARILSDSGNDRLLGTSVVILRTQRYSSDQYAFLTLALGLLGALIAFMFLVCWRAARKVTAPMRRLAVDMQAMAEGDFSRRSGLADGGELGVLAQSFNSMAERLRVAWVNEKETSRLESDLAIARSIQNNLLPPQTPRVRGLDIYTAYRPAKEIGGDYYDFLPVDNQHVGIAVADASGKSIPAALVMSTTRAILRFVAPGNNSAAETLTRVNAILSVDIPKGMFVTAYYVIFDPLSTSMICASAGHTPLLLAREDGSVELLNPGGIALGFDSGPIFQRSIREQRVKLEKGDRVLLYTDGVVECVNTSNEEYSDRRLREFLRRNRELTSHDFIGALLADLDRHRGAADMRDDTTIVTFKAL